MDTAVTHGEGPTKTSETMALYDRIFERLSKITREELRSREAPVPEGETPAASAIVAVFREREGTWSKSTAKLYRVALNYALMNMGTPDAYEARQLLMRDFEGIYADEEKRHNAIEGARAHDERVAAERLQRLAAIRAGEEKPNTSAQKAKSLRTSDMVLLLSQFAFSKSKWALPTQLWFMAGYLTGLRPIEWGTAELGRDDNDRRVLIVKNAKATNGRTFGVDRTIVVEHLKPAEIAVVERHLARANQEWRDGTYADYYDGCRGCLHAIVTRLWPKRRTHPTLYTSRHLFASDAKSVFSKIQVAALMGHGSERTAGLHYGKRRHAKGAVKVEPSAEDVAAVTKLNPGSGVGTEAGKDGRAGGGYV